MVKSKVEIYSDFLKEIGVSTYHNLILHSSYRFIKNKFDITIDDTINEIQKIVTSNGALITPTFTYNWKFQDKDSPIFDRINSESKTGAVTEVFRKMPDVNRTSSPTHSFAIWGNIKNYFNENNSPKSPLGKNSVMQWLAENDNSYILLLGTDFSSLSFLHYLEILFKVRWVNFSPWEYLSVLPIGVGSKGEEILIELPGCSNSFTNFQNYLLNKNVINNFGNKEEQIYYIPCSLLISEGEYYFNNFYEGLLCPKNQCYTCDSRRNKYL